MSIINLLRGKDRVDYQEIQNFKAHVLEEIDANLTKTSSSSEVEVEILLDQPAAKRIAVGISKLDQQDYRLELRVQRQDKWAFNYAEKLAQKHPHRVNIETIPRIEVPSRISSRNATRCTPIIDFEESALELGLSIGPKDSGIGTLGAFIRRSDGDYALSCFHVMVPTIKSDEGNMQLGHPIFHPGREPRYSLGATRQIGKLKDYIVISRIEENTMDCAIAKLDPKLRHTGNIIPKGYGYPNEGKAIRLMAAQENELQRDTKLCKIGRTTCYTCGVLRAFEFDYLHVHIPGEGYVIFTDVLEVRSISKDEPFSLPGDSGSLVFTEDTLEAVGIVFAGGEREDGYKVSYVCKLHPIMEWTQAEWI